MVLLQSSMVPLGSPAHDFNLMGIDDQWHDLDDYARAKVLVIIFMCNHCPYVQEIWDDLVALEKSTNEEVQFLGVNSNANPNYPEDSFEKMKEYAAERGQEFPYLFDEGQKVAKQYDAQCTPDIFVYGPQRSLKYRGAFAGLSSAIDSILKNEEPAQEQTHSMGCSIKWMD
jgi:peroxiredoxin